MTATCPLCGDGHIVRDSWPKKFEHNGVELTAEYHQQYCDTCGSLLQTPEIIRGNNRSKQRAKNAYERLLCGDDIRALRERFGFTQKEMATLFGGGPTAFAKYEADEIAHNAAMDKLLRLCADEPENVVRLARQAGVKLSDDTLGRIDGDSRRRLLNDVEKAVSELGNTMLTWSWTLEGPCNDNIFQLRTDAPTRRSLEHLGKVA